MKDHSKNSASNWKDRLEMVYSTNPSLQYELHSDEKVTTLPPSGQNLRVILDKKGRGGKTVTLITGFEGNEDDLKELGRLVKSKCGVGGTVKDGEILVQGSFVEKVLQILLEKGYKAKRIG